MRKIKPRLIICILPLLFGGCATVHDNPWGRVTTIEEGPPESIGAYSAGCLQGAVSLTPDGKGFEVMHPSRRRYYGHPLLVEFINQLGEEVSDRKLGVLLLGDLGQARGGPMPTGHLSHQIGLDVDIWYWMPDFARTRGLTLDERENLRSVSVLAPDGESMDSSKWSERNIKILELASKNDRVERIFVNPAIKRDLCKNVQDRSWLKKLRPWWGHDDHFHVRLHCPEGSAICSKQAPIPEGDGCGKDLDWWSGPEAREKGKELAKPSDGKLPKLPDACSAFIRGT